jgi:hypothetical protein
MDAALREPPGVGIEAERREPPGVWITRFNSI